MPQRLRYPAKQLVAHIVAERVVDRLEPIEIHEEECSELCILDRGWPSILIFSRLGSPVTVS